MSPRTIAVSRLVPLLRPALDASPAYRGLADTVRLLVADGRVPVGSRLPSERELSAALGVSRTTVTRAYAELRDRGYLTSRQGSGSVTALPGDLPDTRQGTALHPHDEQTAGDLIDLTCASMSAPPGTVAAYEAAVTELPRYLAGTGYHPLGLARLREAIARRYTERGLATTPDQVIVTSGALSGLALACRALLAPGDRVVLENPTYPNAVEAVRRGGARPVAHPLDTGGWDAPALDATLRQTAPRAAYLIPDFHNPTGALMDEADRAAVGAALAGTHTVAIVDETLSELAHDPDLRMRRPLAAHHARTVSLGSASKSFWGGLRIGWVRAPRDLVAPLLSARLTLDLGAPVLEQLVLVHLLEHREEVLAHRRDAVVRSRDALVAGLRDRLPQWRFRVPEGGLCLWVELPESLSTPLCVAADRRGLVLAPGSQFGVDGGMDRYLRLPFTGHAPEVLTDAVDRLAAAWDEAASGRVGGTRRPPLVA